MRLPFNKRNRVTSPFGYRAEFKDNHAGIDIVGDDDPKVHSVCDGTVITSTKIDDKNNLTWQWGNYVKIDDENGNSYYYCHLSQRNVISGQKIAEGQEIGVMGNTGFSFGAHLHFEVRNKSNCAIMPAGDGGVLSIKNECGTYYDMTHSPAASPENPALYKIEIGPVTKGDLNRFTEMAEQLKVPALITLTK